MLAKNCRHLKETKALDSQLDTVATIKKSFTRITRTMMFRFRPICRFMAFPSATSVAAIWVHQVIASTIYLQHSQSIRVSLETFPSETPSVSQFLYRLVMFGLDQNLDRRRKFLVRQLSLYRHRAPLWSLCTMQLIFWRFVFSFWNPHLIYFNVRVFDMCLRISARMRAVVKLICSYSVASRTVQRFLIWWSVIHVSWTTMIGNALLQCLFKDRHGSSKVGGTMNSRLKFFLESVLFIWNLMDRRWIRMFPGGASKCCNSHSKHVIQIVPFCTVSGIHSTISWSKISLFYVSNWTCYKTCM